MAVLDVLGYIMVACEANESGLVRVAAANISPATHFLVVKMECVDADGVYHHVAIDRTPEAWRNSATTAIRKISRGAIMAPFASAGIDDAQLQTAGTFLSLDAVTGFSPASGWLGAFIHIIAFT